MSVPSDLNGNFGKVNQCRFPAGAYDFSLLQKAQTDYGLTHLSIQWLPHLFFAGEGGGENCRGVKLSNHLQLGPRSRMSGAIPQLSLCAFVGSTQIILPFYL